MKKYRQFEDFFCLIMIINQNKTLTLFPAGYETKRQPAFCFAQKIRKNQGEEGSRTVKKTKKGKKVSNTKSYRKHSI